MNEQNDVFENTSIPKSVARMAIPSIITTLVVVIYNMADTFFIGQTGDPIKVAAVSLVFPVFSVFLGMGSLFGVGGSSAISRALGEGNEKRAKNISAFCIYGGIAVGLILMAVILLFMDPILNLIGASEATYGHAQGYLTIVAFGSPFVVMAATCGNILRGEGAATASMIGNMIGTISNIILDPIFILGFGWGVAGAAAATVIGNSLACVFYIIYFLRTKTKLSIDIKKFRMGDHIATNVLAIGIPASLNELLMSLATVIMNQTITQYGDIPLAAMNVAMKANMIVVFVQMGLCMGVQPLFGYNYGSGNKKRLVDIFKFTAFCTVILGTVLTVFMVVARRPVVGAFINDQEVIDYGIRMVIALQVSGPFVGLAYIPAILILNWLFKLNGLIWAQAVADYFSIILGLILCLFTIRKWKPSAEPSGDLQRGS